MGDVVHESYSSVLSDFWEIQQLNNTDLHNWRSGIEDVDSYAMCRQGIHFMKSWRGKLLLSKWWYECKQTTWTDLEVMKYLI